MPQQLPLIGLRVLVTRARHQAGRLSASLSALGAEPIEIPVIEIGPPASWEAMDTALDQIFKYDWILFASANAVDALLDRLESFGRSTLEIARIKMAAIGPATAEALAERGLTASYQPSRFIAEDLIAQFPGYPHLNGRRILWPRTNVGRSYIIDKLTEAGAELDIVPAYTTSQPQDSDRAAQRIINLLKNKHLDIITLASSQSAVNLGKMLDQEIKQDKSLSLAGLLAGVTIAAIGPETSASARKALGKTAVEASHYTIAGLVEAIVSHSRQH